MFLVVWYIAYFPSYSSINRSDSASATVTSAGLNRNDAIQFFRHFLNVKTDKGLTKGIMVTPAYYHSVNPATSFDFVIGYSFETGCQGSFSGFNIRENSGALDVNITYNPVGGATAGTVYMFGVFRRIYLLTVGGLLYITKSQYLSKIGEMDARAEDLLNKLLHISAYA